MRWEMKRRAFTLLLSIIFLWASLAAYSHKIYTSEGQQFKPRSENVAVAVAPKLSVSEQTESDHLLATVASFTITKSHAALHKILSTSLSIRKSVKAYLIFRVFRN
jgi:hypothetical protein